ncbi:hypothetical protein FHG87_018982 [Trinorchestia longiramus]|nr:hypothetical protein FHG87_018982 [Trinorchestia longiramus]
MEIREDQSAEREANLQDNSMSNKETSKACANDNEIRVGGAQDTNQNSFVVVSAGADEAALAFGVQCTKASAALDQGAPSIRNFDAQYSEFNCGAVDAETLISEASKCTVSLKATNTPDAVAFGRTDDSISSYHCKVMVDKMDVTACTTDFQPNEAIEETEVASSYAVKHAWSDKRSPGADRDVIIHSTSPTEGTTDSASFHLGSIAASSRNLTSCKEYALSNNLDESGPDSEDVLIVSSDELTDSDSCTDSDDESDADVSNTSTSTDISSSEEEEASQSSSCSTAGEACYSSVVGTRSSDTTPRLNITSVTKSGPATNESCESDVDCEIDGDRVKFIRNVSLSKQNWNAKVWNSPTSSPKLTAKNIFAKIDKDFKAHTMELKSFPLFSRRHSDIRSKFNFPRCPEFRSLGYSPDLFCKKPSKLSANHPRFPELRSRSAECRVEKVRKIFVPLKNKFNSTPSIDQLPSYSNEKVFGTDKVSISLPEIILPWKTDRSSQLHQSHSNLEGVLPKANGKPKPKCGRALSIPTENRETRSELGLAAKKLKGIPCDVLEGDQSGACFSSVGLERVSRSSRVVRCGTEGSDFYRSHVEAPCRQEFRRRSIPDRKGLSVSAKVAVVFPLRDAHCSDNNGDDSKTTTGLTVGADVRPSSPGGELRPPSVCSAHGPSKPVSPAKPKALSSKHSSKHSSPIKTLPSTTVNAVPDIEHSDSLDSDDQSSRVSTGLGSLEVVVCPVQKTHHVGREIVNTVYGIPIDSLFTLLFTNSKMMLEVHALRKTTGLNCSH